MGPQPSKNAVVLVGLAPARGHFRGRRTIRGGRSYLRHMLLMAAVLAFSWTPVIRAFC